MPSTFSPSLRIELIADGEQAGVWGQTTNNNLGDLLEQAITGSTTVNVTSSDATLTSLNGVVDEARSAVLYVTGTPGTTRIITIPNVPKAYTVKNQSDATVQIKTFAGVAYDCPTLSESYIYCDGSNVITGRSITDGANTILSNTAPFNSPAFTGVPTAPTAAVGTNTTQLATTAFVNAEIANDAPTKTGGGASGTWSISVTGNAGTATALQTARNINGTSFNGTGDITTANWGTARTLTIGNTGKSVNGSGNVSWSLSEIGAPSTNGTGASGTWGINITGNAASVTNGVYNNGGTYGINITGNAGSVTNGVYNNGATYGINITGSSSYAGSAGSVSTVNGASGGSITSATTVNGNFTVNGGRPIYLENGSGSAFIRGDSGGWNIRWAFMNSTGTSFGGFGAFGSGTNPSYYYVADDTISTGVYLPYGGNAWGALSDITKKIVYGKIENAVAKVCTLDALYYNYTTDSPNARRRVGLNAQQVREVLPEAVSELQLPDDEEKTLSVAYTDLIPLLVAAVKELQAEVATLKTKVGV